VSEIFYNMLNDMAQQNPKAFIITNIEELIKLRFIMNELKNEIDNEKDNIIRYQKTMIYNSIELHYILLIGFMTDIIINNRIKLDDKTISVIKEIVTLIKNLEKAKSKDESVKLIDELKLKLKSELK